MVKERFTKPGRKIFEGMYRKGDLCRATGVVLAELEPDRETQYSLFEASCGQRGSGGLIIPLPKVSFRDMGIRPFPSGAALFNPLLPRNEG
ncbi:MAG: hypothetical protein A4E73_01302 [Syntrophaceae bacterium PtaU1.Bin231]|nr:MAG: hypothetical protein A4E73_01302 [Syntrophaceae bacterium PtaU1.Bin231]